MTTHEQAVLEEQDATEARVIEESYPIACARQLDDQQCERADGSDVCLHCAIHYTTELD